MLVQVEQLLQENKLCVLCTAGDGKPHCSLMTYMLSENQVLYMVVSIESKKYQNMMGNPHVSLLIDNRKGPSLGEQIISAVTLTGICQSVGPAELAKVKIKFTETYSELAEIINSPSSALFGVKLKSFLLLAGPVNSLGEIFSRLPSCFTKGGRYSILPIAIFGLDY